MVLSELIANAGLIDTAATPAAAPAHRPARLVGLPLVDGMARGLAVFHQPRVTIEHIVAEDIEAERHRVYAAFDKMREQIERMTSQAEFGVGGEHDEVLATYKMFAYDEGWSRRINEAIDSGLTAEAAIERVQQRTRMRMRQIDDPLLRDRMHDLEDLSNRLLSPRGHRLLRRRPPRRCRLSRSIGPERFAPAEAVREPATDGRRGPRWRRRAQDARLGDRPHGRVSKGCGRVPARAGGGAGAGKGRSGAGRGRADGPARPGRGAPKGAGASRSTSRSTGRSTGRSAGRSEAAEAPRDRPGAIGGVGAGRGGGGGGGGGGVGGGAGPGAGPRGRTGGPVRRSTGGDNRVGRPDKDQKGLGGEQVEGRQAVRELLLAGRRKVRDIWISDDVEHADVITEIERLAAAAKVVVRYVPRGRLEREALTEVVQGVLAHAAGIPEADLDELVADPRAFLVLLDGVTDPHNLGAVLRSAEFVGATGCVLPRHRAAHVTPTVAKASAGAVEHVPLSVVSGLPDRGDEAAQGRHLGGRARPGRLAPHRRGGRRTGRPTGGPRARCRGRGALAPGGPALRRGGPHPPGGVAGQSQRVGGGCDRPPRGGSLRRRLEANVRFAEER